MIELLMAGLAGAGVAGAVLSGFRRRHAAPMAGSGRSGYPSLGSIPLVGARGLERRATYRGVYLTNPWIYAAVNKRARDLARLRLHVYELDAEGDRRRVRGDVPTTPGRPAAGESLDRLLLRPNTRMSRYATMYGTAVDRQVYGNGLWRIERAGGMPSELYREPWRNVARVDEVGGDVNYYELGRDRPSVATGQRRRLVPDDVVHFGKGMDAESSIGISSLESCRYSIALYEAVVRHLVAFFENSARPSGVVNRVENLTREKANLIRELLEEAYASPENAGKILVTAGEWASTTETPEHSQVVELIKLSREEAAAVFNIPPPVLGILEDAIKSNVKELREQYIRESLGPWATEFEEDLAAQLLPLSPSWRYLFCEFQLAEQLRPDLEAMAMVFQRLQFVYTVDEIRKILNLAPLSIPGITDVPWVPSGSMPLPRAAAGARNKQQGEAGGNGHGAIERLEETHAGTQ